MPKNEYKITKDKDIFGQRYETYSIEKIITHDNGEVEKRYRVWIPFRDGDITKVDLNKLEFQKPITTEEWNQLSREYQKAWLNGTLTEELCQELRELRAKEGVA